MDLPADAGRLPKPSVEVGNPKADNCLDVYLDRDQVLDRLGPVRIRYEAGGLTPKLLFADERRLLIALDDRVHEIDFAARAVLRQIRVDISIVGITLFDLGLLVIGEAEVVALDRRRELWRTAARDLVISFTLANGRLTLKLDDGSVETLSLATGDVLRA